MKSEYEHKKIEPKWQKIWQDNAAKWQAKDFSKKKKYYCLFEFPYPSGEGLHMGHLRGQTASDVISRKKRMEGYNVMLPIGWDAFGLPTENYAIKNKIHPKIATEKNITNFRKQERRMGYLFDWDREINTTDPKYYRWTQWIFLQLFKHGLAYKAKMPINWCGSCKIGLANEEVIDGKCERCGVETSKREISQWMLKITAYAQKLLEGLKEVDFPERVKTQQVNWIGKSSGTTIRFRIVIASNAKQSNADKKIATSPSAPRNDIIEVFTTRADTLFGCTYLVLSPEHPAIKNLQFTISNFQKVEEYIEKAKRKTDLERTKEGKEKTGVRLEGIKAINPINNEEVDVFVADYVLAGYGTGAIMAVPAHDQRDYEFAKKYKLPIKEVIIPKVIDRQDPPKDGEKTVYRRAIQVILINPKDDKVLCLKWKKFPWTTFITGGVEEGENIINAAKREIQEETGYRNVKYIKTLGGPVESHFYANHKRENRKAYFSALVFELLDEKRDIIAQTEDAIHEVSWVSWDELRIDKNVKCSEFEIWLDRLNNKEHAFCDYGVMINSGEFNDLTSEEGMKKVTEKLKKLGMGDFAINYKLRDWVFSRQHYWGEPIPIVFCANCAKNNRQSQKSILRQSSGQAVKSQKYGIDFIEIDGKEYAVVPVPEENLPVLLPEIEHYEPTETGESPLAIMTEWVNTKCPVCGGEAKRETDTMPNWAGSSWYYLAYAMKIQNPCLAGRRAKSKIQKKGNIFEENKEELKYWIPVDLYEGGPEHTTLHLLYSRFWNQFLYDIKVVSLSEPYKKRISHGMILANDGRKMSKSFGNVVNPDGILKKYGTDTARVYIMFIGPFEQAIAWDDQGIIGVHRFLKKFWLNMNKPTGNNNPEDLTILHQTIQGVSDDIDHNRFNTAIAKLMELNNYLTNQKAISDDVKQACVKLIVPFAPHIAEELWEINKFSGYVFEQGWPQAEEKYLAKDIIALPVQINGKVRSKIDIGVNENKERVLEIVKGDKIIQNWLQGKKIKKVIYRSGQIINLVV